MEQKLPSYPVKIAVNDTGSKYLEATRDIQKGEIIFVESPLLTGPRVREDFQIIKTGKFPLCLECYKIVRGNYRCSKCMWPLCGRSCEMGKMHSKFECSIFASYQIPPIEEHEVYHYASICTLRALMLKTIEPKKWELLTELDSKQTQRQARGDDASAPAVEFILRECRQTQFDENEIDFVGGILQINRMSAEFSKLADDMPFGSYVYHKVNFASHTCVPNSMWFITSNNDDLKLRASIAIKMGEMVTSSYVDLEDGTFIRRANLQKHMIDCKCLRCSDDTELGTYMSAMKCQNSDCFYGYYLMVNPLVENSLWRCNKCGHSKTSSNVESILAEIDDEANAIEFSWSAQSTPELHLEHIKKLEDFLNKHEGKTLHKNHSILYRCKKKLGYLIPLICVHMENESDRQILEIKQVLLVKSCLDVVNVCWPGYSRGRGQLLYNLQRGLFCMIFSEVENLALDQTNVFYNTQVVLLLQMVFKTVLAIRKEVKTILEIESDGKVEKEYANEMEYEGVDFDALRRLIHVPA